MSINNAINNSANSAAYVPTLTAISNSGTLANVRSAYFSNGVSAGNWVTIISKFTVVPSAISFVTSISIPIGNNFSGSGKANLMGGIIYDNGTNAIIGTIIDADSASGNAVRIQFSVAAGALNIGNTVNISLGYLIQ